MKAEQVTAVMNEMKVLFAEYSMKAHSIAASGKPFEMQVAALEEAQREQAKKATDIVTKHCHWPDTLGQQLKRVCAYIDEQEKAIAQQATNA